VTRQSDGGQQTWRGSNENRILFYGGESNQIAIEGIVKEIVWRRIIDILPSLGLGRRLRGMEGNCMAAHK
jgi:hypothetical protein